MTWNVSGNTNVLIDNNSLKVGGDHILKLSNVPDFVGIEILVLMVTDPEGNSDLDTITVEVISSTVIEVRVIANPVSEEFIDLIIISTDTLIGDPEILLKFDEKTAKVDANRISNSLVWKGDYIFDRGKEGKINVKATSVDRFKTVVRDSTNFTLGAASPGKKAIIVSDNLILEIEENTFISQKPIYIIPEHDRNLLIDEVYDKYSVDGIGDPIYFYDIEMGKQPLRKKALISFMMEPVDFKENMGIFYINEKSNKIEFLDNSLFKKTIFKNKISSSGKYFVAADEIAPVIENVNIATHPNILLEICYYETGSGIDVYNSEIIIDEVSCNFSIEALKNNMIIINVEDTYEKGDHDLHIKLKDKLGNYSQIYKNKFNVHNEMIPSQYELYQNFPNPFNPETKIRFFMADDGYAALTIYSIIGQKIRTLVSEQKNAGTHNAIWDGKNADGISVSSGVYIYVLQTNGFKKSRKMIYAK